MRQLHGFLSLNIQQKVQLLEHYDSILKSFLAAPLPEHVVVTRIHEETLHLLVDTQTWANNLHYYKSDLAKRFSSELNTPIQSVMIRVDSSIRIQKKKPVGIAPKKVTNPHRLHLRKILKKL
jgi:hypothetical protein